MNDELPPGSIWPAHGEEACQMREVYSRYGLAMYFAQVLEHSIVNTLMMMRLMPTITDFSDRQAWEEAFDEFFDQQFGKTFGNMLRELETTNALPQDITNQLRLAKFERDYLAHKFFRENAQEMMSPLGRTQMVCRCEQSIELFQVADERLEEFAAPYREKSGLTDEKVNKWIARLESASR